jgi:hypothetical protein
VSNVEMLVNNGFGRILQEVVAYFSVLSQYFASPVAARSQVWVCGRSLAGIMGSNPVGGIDVCLL